MNSPMMVPETTRIAAVESWQGGEERGAEPKWTTSLYRSRDTLLHQNGGKTENGAVHVSEFMNWLVMT